METKALYSVYLNRDKDENTLIKNFSSRDEMSALFKFYDCNSKSNQELEGFMVSNSKQNTIIEFIETEEKFQLESIRIQVHNDNSYIDIECKLL